VTHGHDDATNITFLDNN